jgi:hypothetical protein
MMNITGGAIAGGAGIAEVRQKRHLKISGNFLHPFPGMLFEWEQANTSHGRHKRHEYPDIRHEHPGEIDWHCCFFSSMGVPFQGGSPCHG